MRQLILVLTPVLGDLMPFSGLHGHCMHMAHIDSYRHTHTNERIHMHMHSPVPIHIQMQIHIVKNQ